VACALSGMPSNLFDLARMIVWYEESSGVSASPVTLHACAGTPRGQTVARVISARGKLHIFIRTHDPQYGPHRNREMPPRRITHDLRCGKPILLPPRPEFAPTCRNHILHPFGFAAVGERNDESIGRSKDVHRSAVDLSRLPTDVLENTKTRQPACEETGDSVRKGDIDLREPSLLKPHHQHARGGDEGDYDDSEAHRSLVFRDAVTWQLQPIPPQQKRSRWVASPEPERSTPGR